VESIVLAARTARDAVVTRRAAVAARHRHTTPLQNAKQENVAALPPIDNVDAVEVVASGGSGSGPSAAWVIRNAPGTAASAKIFAHLAAANGGEIGPAAALEGLRLYGEYVDEARAVPGSHPNIDILLNIAEAGAPPVRVTLKEK
jgi:hypothetical protein